MKRVNVIAASGVMAIMLFAGTVVAFQKAKEAPGKNDSSSTAQAVKLPVKLTFPAKNGSVSFDHATHVKRAKGDCKACHDKLFPESSKAPLNYQAGLHKAAESSKASCAACHVQGGAAFESKSNCNKCHVKS